VFEMFKGHQGGKVLPTTLRNAEAVSASSTQRNGRTPVSVANHHPTEGVVVEIALAGVPTGRLAGRLLAGERFNDHNTFDQPDRVKPTVWMVSHGAGDVVTAELPPASVATLECAG
jgi:alpha-N-arabinofuranosidase